MNITSFAARRSAATVGAWALLIALAGCAASAHAGAAASAPVPASSSSSVSVSVSPSSSASAPASTPTDSTSAPTVVPYPCTLLSDAEVTTSFDTGPKHGTPSTSGSVKRCDYGDGVVVSIEAMTASDFTAATGAIAGIRPVSINGQAVYIHDSGATAAETTTDFYVGKDGLRVEFQCRDPEDNGIPAMTDLSVLLVARI